VGPFKKAAGDNTYPEDRFAKLYARASAPLPLLFIGINCVLGIISYINNIINYIKITLFLVSKGTCYFIAGKLLSLA
jgi:hypothetical protein